MNIDRESSEVFGNNTTGLDGDIKEERVRSETTVMPGIGPRPSWTSYS